MTDPRRDHAPQPGREREPGDVDDAGERRLMALEVKLSFLDDQVEQLDGIVAHQQRQLDRLLRQVSQLQQQLQDASAGTPARNLRDELPPHY